MNSRPTKQQHTNRVRDNAQFKFRPIKTENYRAKRMDNGGKIESKNERQRKNTHFWAKRALRWAHCDARCARDTIRMLRYCVLYNFIILK